MYSTFIYSQEEGTPAGVRKDQISQEVKISRFDEIMTLQRQISAENNIKYIGKTFTVLVDEINEDNGTQYIGRTQMDAPEVDGVIFIDGEDIEVGEFIKVKVTGTMEYDLIGEQVKV